MHQFANRSVACTTLMLLLAAPLRAQPISVQNPGFEANFAAPNSFPLLVPTGWMRFDPGNILDMSRDALGVLNPTSGTNFPAGAPEGRNVALVFLSGDVGVAPAGLRQRVNAVLSAQTRYRLVVEVGNIASGIGNPPFDFFFDLDGFPGYAVQLLAGGVVVAQDNNSLFGMIPEGEFRTSTVELTTTDSHPRMGAQLEIRLINLNIPGTAQEPAIEVNFDNVRLDAAPGCRADFNADGSLNPDDLADFINCFFEAPPCPGADFSGEGDVNPDDLADYINAYFDGCA